MADILIKEGAQDAILLSNGGDINIRVNDTLVCRSSDRNRVSAALVITSDSSRLSQIAQYSTLSLDPADYQDLLPETIAWAKEHGFTELTVNPNNLSSYISYIVGHIDAYPEFKQEVRRLLIEEGLRGVEFEHALITYIIQGFLKYFERVSYEVVAEI
jgi:hypothetical protein